MRVGITYDLRNDYLAEGYSDEETAEFDKEETIEAIEAEIHAFGFETERIGNIKSLVKKLANGERWDWVFNISEGMHGIGREAQVPALLDAYQIPHTFSNAMILALTLDKAMTKRVIRDMGIITPDFLVVEKLEDLKNISLQFPLFAKPLAEGTSKGIDRLSKVNNNDELYSSCASLLEKFKQPVLVEEYLPGREFTVGIVGTGVDSEAIGVMEILLKSSAEKESYSYANKQNYEELVDYTVINGSLAEDCKVLALKAWNGLGCCDAGRVDIRIDREGRPSFIEINPLAGVNPNHSDLPILCRCIDIPYRVLMGKLINSTLKRIKHG